MYNYDLDLDGVKVIDLGLSQEDLMTLDAFDVPDELEVDLTKQNAYGRHDDLLSFLTPLHNGDPIIAEKGALIINAIITKVINNNTKFEPSYIVLEALRGDRINGCESCHIDCGDDLDASYLIFVASLKGQSGTVYHILQQPYKAVFKSLLHRYGCSYSMEYGKYVYNNMPQSIDTLYTEIGMGSYHWLGSGDATTNKTLILHSLPDSSKKDRLRLRITMKPKCN